MLDMQIHKKTMLKEIERHRTILDEVEAIVNALPDELPDGVAMHAGNWAVYLDIAYDWDLYRQVRRCLRDWIPTSVHDNLETGEKFYVLRPPDAGPYDFTKLYIALKPGMNHSKCRVEVVGKREVDIVQVVCE